MVKLPRDENIEILCRFSLFCNATKLEQRIKIRNTSGIMNIERALECNEKIKKLETEFLINTTHRKPKEISKLFCDSIESFIKEI